MPNAFIQSASHPFSLYPTATLKHYIKRKIFLITEKLPLIHSRRQTPLSRVVTSAPSSASIYILESWVAGIRGGQDG